jgi:hypothetical protein
MNVHAVNSLAFDWLHKMELLHQTLQILWATAITRSHSNNEFSYISVVKKSLK